MIKPVFAALFFCTLGCTSAQAQEMQLASALLAPTLSMQTGVSPQQREPVRSSEESSLRADFDRAVWPGDIVRAADAYLRVRPEAADVAAQRETAAQVLQLLRSPEVLLFRNSFTVPDPAMQGDLRLAALGDRAAAVRLAEASRGHDATHGTRRYVGWMQLASLLHDADASYRLALHFRRSGQPLLAAQYETVALALGYVPLPSLNNTRK